jgi:hypothetical protein
MMLQLSIDIKLLGVSISLAECHSPGYLLFEFHEKVSSHYHMSAGSSLTTRLATTGLVCGFGLLIGAYGV